MNIAHCHTCPARQRPCYGPCACTLDGRDIQEHARDGFCPRGRFAAPDPPRPAPVPLDPAVLAVVERQRGPAGCCG